MANKKFEDYGFKPSTVIAGLNKWYETGDKHALIRFADHFFYDHDKAIDDAIKYLRSMDIFYQPGLKWDDVKLNISTEACLREYGYPDIHSAWPKVNPCFVGPRTERENEIRDYILKRADVNGVKVPTTFRTNSVETLIAYLFELFVQERENKELTRRENRIQVTERENMIRNYILRHADDEGIAVPKALKDPRSSVENLIAYLFALLIHDRKNKELAEEIRDRYCEKNAKLQKELDQWERWFEQQKKLMEEE